MQTMTNYVRKDKLVSSSKTNLMELEPTLDESCINSVRTGSRRHISQHQTVGSRKAMTNKGGSVGISKDNKTCTTGYTTQVGGNTLLQMEQDVTTAGDILNYPYSYDQDRAQEVVFQEKLYRASHE